MAAEVQLALGKMRAKIAAACAAAGRREPTLVAVSKTKPVSLLQAAYDDGQRHFGENYVQEIIAKAPVMPADIKWHFIGHLQSNKCKVVAAVPNLFVVETVDSEKLATQLQKACVTVGRASRLRVLVQVNTSGEESKFGCAPADAVAVATYIAQRCPNLELAGLMTIGRLEAEPAPECFEILLQCRQRVSDALQISIDSLELSMGMSGDLELACAMGSTNVRVGSAIFGHRDYGIKIKPESDDERPAADESAAASSKSA